MSIEALVTDLTNALRENTDSNNKLIIAIEGKEADASPAKTVAAKAKPAAKAKEEPATKPAAKAKEEPATKPAAKAKEEPAPEVEEEAAEGTEAQDAELYKMMQERLISLVGKYEEDGEVEPKVAHKKAVEFMKEKTGCTRLDKVAAEQYQIFIDELEEELA